MSRADEKTAFYLHALLGPLGTEPAFPESVSEYRFHPVRKWAFDRAWVEKKVALEIEGAGRHMFYNAYEMDCWKYSEAAVAGWKVIRLTWGLIKRDIDACRDLLRRALA